MLLLLLLGRRASGIIHRTGGYPATGCDRCCHLITEQGGVCSNDLHNTDWLSLSARIIVGSASVIDSSGFGRLGNGSHRRRCCWRGLRSRRRRRRWGGLGNGGFFSYRCCRRRLYYSHFGLDLLLAIYRLGCGFCCCHCLHSFQWGWFSLFHGSGCGLLNTCSLGRGSGGLCRFAIGGLARAVATTTLGLTTFHVTGALARFVLAFLWLIAIYCHRFQVFICRVIGLFRATTLAIATAAAAAFLTLTTIATGRIIGTLLALWLLGIIAILALIPIAVAVAVAVAIILALLTGLAIPLATAAAAIAVALGLPGLAGCGFFSGLGLLLFYDLFSPTEHA